MAETPQTMLDLVPSLDMPGFRLVDTGELFQLLQTMLSVTTNVAATGTTRATGKQLTSATNVVLSASGTQNSVILPPGLIGRQVLIINNASVALNVWPYNPIDYIIPSGSGTPAPNAAQGAQTSGVYICMTQVLNPPPLLISYWKQAAPV